MFDIEYVSSDTYQAVFLTGMPLWFVQAVVQHVLKPGDKLTIVRRD